MCDINVVIYFLQVGCSTEVWNLILGALYLWDCAGCIYQAEAQTSFNVTGPMEKVFQAEINIWTW